MTVPAIFSRLWQSLTFPKLTATCGHVVSSLGYRGFCSACLASQTIPCAWCSKEIKVGDQVALHTSPDNHIPSSEAVVYSRRPLTVVGCLHCSKPAAAAGIWSINHRGYGFVQLIATATTSDTPAGAALISK